MLPQDRLDADQNLPPAQIRVTQEELTQALAALEDRKQEAARRREEEERYLAQTIPIGQAVQDLRLDATPEEVWAEVQAQRQREEEQERGRQSSQSQSAVAEEVSDGTLGRSGRFHYDYIHWETQPGPPSPLPWKGFVAVAAPLVGLAAFIGLMSNASHSPARPFPLSFVTTTQGPVGFSQGVNPFNRITRTIDDSFYQKLWLCQGPNPAYHLMHVQEMTPGAYGLQPDETVYPARAVPDGYSVFNDRVTGYPDQDTVSSGGVVFRDAADPVFTSAQGSHLITTRYDGVRYARCWIDRNDIDALKRHHRVALYFCGTGSDAPDPAGLVPITIRLVQESPAQAVSNFWLRGATLTTDAPNRFLLPEGQNIVLDRHAKEKFPAMILPTYVPPQWAKTPGVFNDRPGPSDFQVMQDYREFDASSILKRAKEVPNNSTFHGGAMTLMKLASRPVPGVYAAVPTTETLIDVRPHLGRPYTFVKYDGHIYLRGWTAERLTDQQIESHVISIATTPDNPIFLHPAVPIQLRLDACRIMPNPMTTFYGMNGRGGGTSTISASDIHLDGRAWEKW